MFGIYIYSWRRPNECARVQANRLVITVILVINLSIGHGASWLASLNLRVCSSVNDKTRGAKYICMYVSEWVSLCLCVLLGQWPAFWPFPVIFMPCLPQIVLPLNSHFIYDTSDQNGWTMANNEWEWNGRFFILWSWMHLTDRHQIRSWLAVLVYSLHLTSHLFGTVELSPRRWKKERRRETRLCSALFVHQCTAV